VERGLYYYRTGWQAEMSSDDVVFSFYSGKFHSAHAQEDQNQFTLYAYGGKFAIDHGAGGTAKQSESHNMVLIDGAGQHNAGSSIGTDGRIAGYLLSDFADHVAGDATDAYTTYSEFNAPDWPFPGWDWSWGYHGANPVDHALRNVVVVHDADTPPYFIVVDDIDKDGAPHDFQWRMHTAQVNTIDTSSNPIRIDAPAASMDVHVLYPEFSSLARSTSTYDNGVADPDATVLELEHTAVNPLFSLLLFPADSTVAAPVVARETLPWGFACTLDWGGGVADVVVGNFSGGAVTWGADSLRTDASIAVVRTSGSAITRHLLVDATELYYRSDEYVRIFDAPVTCGLDGGVIHLDREDAAFSILDTGVDRIVCRDSDVPFVRRSGYLLSDPASGAGEAPLRKGQLRVSVYPNPFNPAVTVRIDVPRATHVAVAIYDVTGRPVKTFPDRAVIQSRTVELTWDGTNRNGRQVPSGVYLLKVTAGGVVRTQKLVVVR
jgi:hypothetical protein